MDDETQLFRQGKILGQLAFELRTSLYSRFLLPLSRSIGRGGEPSPCCGSHRENQPWHHTPSRTMWYGLIQVDTPLSRTTFYRETPFEEELNFICFRSDSSCTVAGRFLPLQQRSVEWGANCTRYAGVISSRSKRCLVSPLNAHALWGSR